MSREELDAIADAVADRLKTLVFTPHSNGYPVLLNGQEIRLTLVADPAPVASSGGNEEPKGNP